jgi:hypothetical protein
MEMKIAWISGKLLGSHKECCFDPSRMPLGCKKNAPWIAPEYCWDRSGMLLGSQQNAA